MNAKKAKSLDDSLEDALAKTDNTLPAEIQSGDWGAVEDLDTTDLIVPKVFHQQALSEFVSNGDASPGDFCDSLTGEVLAKKDGGLEVIIFGTFKTLLISKQEQGGSKFNLDRIVTITKQNAVQYGSRPFEETLNGVVYQNRLQYNYYCVIPGKIDELPYVLSLGGMKLKVAKKLNTMLYKLSQMKKPGASKVFKLSNVQEKNDRGSWFGLTIDVARDSTGEELKTAHEWYQKSKTQNFVVEEEGQQPRQTDNGGPAPTGPVEDSQVMSDDDDSIPF